MLVHQLFEENVTIETWIKRINKLHPVGGIDNAAALRLRKKAATFAFSISLPATGKQQKDVEMFANDLKLFANALKEKVPSFIGFELSKDKKFLPLNDLTYTDISKTIATPVNDQLLPYDYSLVFDAKTTFQVKDLSSRLSEIFKNAGEQQKLVPAVDYVFNPKAAKGIFTAVGPSGILRSDYCYFVAPSWTASYPAVGKIPQLYAVTKLAKKLSGLWRKNYGKYTLEMINSYNMAKNGLLEYNIKPNFTTGLELHSLTSDEEHSKSMRQIAAKHHETSLAEAANGVLPIIEKAGKTIDYVLVYPKNKAASTDIPDNAIKLAPSQVTVEKLLSQSAETGICIGLHVDDSEIESPNDMEIISKLLAAAEPALNDLKASLPESRTMSWKIDSTGIPSIKIEVK